MSQFRALLFFAHGPWQPSTATVKHNKLCKSLAKYWEVDSFTRRSTELAFKSDRGTRYAGLLEVSENTLGKQFWINILLTLLGYIPGIVHAVWVFAKY